MRDELEWLYSDLEEDDILIGPARHQAKAFKAFVTDVAPGSTKGRIQVNSHTWFFLVDYATLKAEGIRLVPGLKVFFNNSVFEVVLPTKGIWEFNDPYELRVAIRAERTGNEIDRNNRIDTNNS